MIKLTVDNKVQTEKEIRKHGNMLPISIRGIYTAIELRQNKCVDKFAEKSTWHTFRECVHVLEVASTKILG